MKTSGYFTPVRIVFWAIMLGCVAVLGFLIVALFLPHNHKGSDRAGCIMQQRNLQQAVRAYADTNLLKIGDSIDWAKIIGTGQYIERVPECPIHGKDAYEYTPTIPSVGTLAAPCKDPAHKPPNTEDW